MAGAKCSTQRQKQQGQQGRQQPKSTSTPASSTPASGGPASSPESPGFLAALAAIEAAEQQEEVGTCWHTDHTPAGPCSLSTSPSTASDYNAWQQLRGSSSSDPWVTSVGSQPNQPSSLSSSPGSAALLQQEQQQEQPDEFPSSWDHAITSSQAYNWRCFAMSFAEAARAAGDEDAADGALQFGASETLCTALLAADDAAALELVGVAAEAAAAGLTVQELLEAQQHELLLQINSSKRKRSNWRQVTLDWGSNNNGNSSSVSPTRPAREQLPDVSDDVAFPQLESSPHSTAWQQVGRSPHAISAGWKGGRLAPKAKGIKLLHAPSSHSSGDRLRPSSLDLHWDLRLDGLAPMQRDIHTASSSSSTDPWGCSVPVRGLCSDGEAAERTRQLLAEQEAAAAAGLRPCGSNRDRLAPDTVRSMMEKAASKGNRLAPVSDPPAEAAEEGPEGAGLLLCGSKASFSYNWSSVFKTALMAGWEPVGKADGGGGSHFKLRRVLPVSGVTQTMVLPCTPSDSQRGVRNVASAFRKKEEEKALLERKAAAAKHTAGKAGRTRCKQKT